MVVTPETLVNGSLGKVVGFFTQQEATERARAMASQRKEGSPRYIETKNQPRAGPGPDEQVLNGHIFADDERQKWPLVRFENNTEYLCKAVDFKVEGSRGNVEARRCQIPLILAWAISIHKSQGQTSTSPTFSSADKVRCASSVIVVLPMLITSND